MFPLYVVAVFLLITRTLSFHNCPTANQDVCSGHGTCLLFNFCFCDPGWQEFDCAEQLTCATEVTPQCVIQGWECDGTGCAEDNVCGGNGVCVAPNACACCPGCVGNNCTDTHAVCDPPCEHGMCLFDGDSGDTFCGCEAGFGGAEGTCAEALQCSGVDPHDPAVCSGRGTCALKLTPVMRNEHTAHYLANFTLDTLHPNDTVDHFSGDEMVCSCKDGWTGVNCSTPASLWSLVLFIVGWSILAFLALALLVFIIYWFIYRTGRRARRYSGDIQQPPQVLPDAGIF